MKLWSRLKALWHLSGYYDQRDLDAFDDLIYHHEWIMSCTDDYMMQKFPTVESIKEYAGENAQLDFLGTKLFAKLVSLVSTEYEIPTAIVSYLTVPSRQSIEEFLYRCDLKREELKSELTSSAYTVTEDTYQELEHLKLKFSVYNAPWYTKRALEHLLQILKP